MADPLEFDFADPDFNFPEFFESFNIQPETDPFSLGPKPVGVSGAATPSEQAFIAASAVNQNDPTFFQSLIDSGRLRLDDDLPGGGTGTPFGQAGSAIPNYALESAMGRGDGRGDGRGGLSGGNVNTRNIGEMFPDFDSLARSVSGFDGDTLRDLTNVFKKDSKLTSGQGGSIGATLGNVLGAPPLGALGGGVGTLMAGGSGGQAVVNTLLGGITGAAPPIGFALSILEALFDPFGFDPTKQQTLRPGHFDEPSPIGDPGAYESIGAWGKVLANAFETGQWGGFGDSTQPFDPNATLTLSDLDPDIAFDIDFTGSLGGAAEPSDPGILSDPDPDLAKDILGFDPADAQARRAYIEAVDALSWNFQEMSRGNGGPSDAGITTDAGITEDFGFGFSDRDSYEWE
jgi:hypothetical protein